MITKQDAECLDGAICQYKGIEYYLSIWHNTITKEVSSHLHRKSDLIEVSFTNLGKRASGNETYKALPKQLKILEVQKASRIDCKIKVTDLKSQASKNIKINLQYFYQKFVYAKECDEGIVFCFVFFEEKTQEVPIGISLLKFDWELNLLNKKDYFLKKIFYNKESTSFSPPCIINFFCASASDEEMGVLFEADDMAPWLFRFSLKSLDLINVVKLVPAENGFGYVTNMLYRDSKLNILATNWTIFELDLNTGIEINSERFVPKHVQRPSILLWDNKWIVGGNYECLGNIQNNAVDFILSIL